jgi:hypothetical protein
LGRRGHETVGPNASNNIMGVVPESRCGMRRLQPLPNFIALCAINPCENDPILNQQDEIFQGKEGVKFLEMKEFAKSRSIV